MKSAIVIPARLKSSRLPGKVLLKIGKKPVVQHVYEQCLKSEKADYIYIAVDSKKVMDECLKFTNNVIMTDEDLDSGTDRVFQVSQNIGRNIDIIINVQGDEPFIDPELIDQLISRLKDDQSLKMVTACNKINDVNEFLDPNVVKVAINHNNEATYFSRAPIPYPRDYMSTSKITNEVFDDLKAYKHLGIYGFRSSFLQTFVDLNSSNFEKYEKLEQLRVLEAGYKISMVKTLYKSIGIDTQDDYENAKRIYEKQILHEKAKNIKAILCDVDGVLTRGDITFDSNGTELKSFNVKDGQIVSHLKKRNFILGAITGRDSAAVRNRCESLHFDFHKHGISNKLKEYERFKKKFDLSDNEISYIGDDIIDLGILSRCGLSATPQDTPDYMKEHVDIVTQAKGGEGVFREVADFILEKQHKLEQLINDSIEGVNFGH